MDLSKYLATTQLMDCNGRVTHTFTLLANGDVEVVTPSATVVVDPVSRSVLRPSGVRVPEQIFDQAWVLAREAVGQQ